MAENIYLWSPTASDNDDADPAVPWPENMLPGAVNNAARSTMAAVARLLADINGTTATTGSANAYLFTSSSGVTAFTNGQLITVRANFTNTSSATLNLNSLGAKAIRVFDSSGETNVGAGQIQSGGTYQLRYDSALNSAAGAWLLLNPAPASDIGSIKMWTTNTVPTNWLFANGQAVSRTTYAALFALNGTTFGSGDGSTTFNVPDLCGRVPAGKDDMGGITAKGRLTTTGLGGASGQSLGDTGGTQTITLATTDIPSHTHTGTTVSGGAHTHSGTADVDGGHTHVGTTDSSGSHSHSYDKPQFSTFNPNAGVVAYAPNTASTSTSTDGAHTHNFTTGTSGAHQHTFSTTSNGAHTHGFTSDATGGGGAHINVQPTLVLNFIIKAL